MAKKPKGDDVSKNIDSNNLDTGRTTKVLLPTEGVIDRSALRDDPIEVVTDASGNLARDLAFMDELVEVEVHESTDPNSDPLVDVYVNGISQRFVRGVPQVCKRKYVQVLATSKPQTLSTKTMVQGDQVMNQIVKTAALRYPFRIVRDDNPRGAAWLRQTLQRG